LLPKRRRGDASSSHDPLHNDTPPIPCRYFVDESYATWFAHRASNKILAEKSVEIKLD
jgi:hypothetical protein